MKNKSKISMSGVMWLHRASKLIDTDTNFMKEYDYIHTVLSSNIRYGTVNE